MRSVVYVGDLRHTWSGYTVKDSSLVEHRLRQFSPPLVCYMVNVCWSSCCGVGCSSSVCRLFSSSLSLHEDGCVWTVCSGAVTLSRCLDFSTYGDFKGVLIISKLVGVQGALLQEGWGSNVEPFGLVRLTPSTLVSPDLVLCFCIKVSLRAK